MTKIVHGCDSAFPPSEVLIEDAKKFKVDWWGGYFGGEAAFHVWSPSDFADVGHGGFKILPIWVPLQKAPIDVNVVSSSMIEEAKKLGIPPGSWLALDCETELSNWLSERTIIQDDLAKAISDGGYKLIVYGVGNLIIPEWKASWYGKSWPMLSIADGWQWSGSSATSYIPGADLDVMLESVVDNMWDGYATASAEAKPAAETSTPTTPAPQTDDIKPDAQVTVSVSDLIAIGNQLNRIINTAYKAN